MNTTFNANLSLAGEYEDVEFEQTSFSAFYEQKQWVLDYNMSECCHGVVLMMQCLRHTDRSAVGGQARTPGC